MTSPPVDSAVTAEGERRGTATSVASVAFVAAGPSPDGWPAPLGKVARHGLAGEFLTLVEPHTEADSAALLLQFLVAFGNLVGRGPHFVAEADQHYCNLFLALVGETAKGRKGASLGYVRRIYETVDEQWVRNCMPSGLSSGEGLIWAVRDPIEKQEPVRDKKKRITGYQLVQVDAGVKDKRALIIESEFASTLRVLGRDGNTLSATVRQSWDTGNLRTLVKNSPAAATGAHIAIIGHITKGELRRYLERTEAGNGFANRFLWICVGRSKLLPEGGRFAGIDITAFSTRIRAAVDSARGAGELQRDDAARDLWRRRYEDLSQGHPGLLGAVTSRAEAQTMRLALIYALLDGSPVIGLSHLKAALEVWRYCMDSARYIFGRDLGDPVADTILAALKASPCGLLRTEIRDLLSRHDSRGMARALTHLAELGLARAEREETGGRPAERWFATGPECDKSDESDQRGAEAKTDAGDTPQAQPGVCSTPTPADASSWGEL